MALRSSAMGVTRVTFPLMLLLCIAACFPKTKVMRDGCQCRPELCPQPSGCLAGLVRDSCGCCLECGNVEGQPCDLEGGRAFHGRCGENLLCEVDMGGLEYGEIPQSLCACRTQKAVCGSNHKTYSNICAFKEAAQASGGARNLSMAGSGPCQTVPEIKLPPRNQVNVTGQDAIFLCEVVAYPMALVEWRKDGLNVSLPGDDPHISVQSRGGPLKYELSSWLQFEGVTMEDVGTYRCIARNRLGHAMAHAELHVTEKGSDPPPGELFIKASEDLSSENDDYGDYY